MNLRATGTSQAEDRGEIAVVAGLLLAFLLLNLSTARTPSVWMDEVMYADPAINWLQRAGFTSTAWAGQHAGEFWASNVPLHAVLLRGWLALAGATPLGVRSLSYLLFAATVLVLWRVVRRHELVRTRALRLAFVATLLLGFGVATSYRSGRYDSVGMLLSAAVAAAALRPAGPGTNAAVFAGAALLPWAGLQLLPYWFCLGAIAWLVAGRAALPRLVLITSALAAGTAGLAAFYRSQGVLDAFLRSVFQHAAGPRHPASWNGLTDPLRIDRTALVLLLVLLAGWAARPKAGLTRAGRVGLLAALLVPPVLLLAGKYPDYYTWMAFLPLCAGGFAQADAWHRLAPWPRKSVFLAGGLLLASSAAGKWLVAALAWHECDPARVAALVAPAVRAGDRVFCDFSAYFAVKARTAHVFVPTYLAQLREDERRAVSVLVVHPRALAELRAIFPGTWVSRGRLESQFAPWQHRLIRAYGDDCGYWLEVFTKADST